MTFGENLQFLRKRANLTQEDLAEKREASRQSVSKWESNLSYPETDAILRLCSLFHCDMDTLLRGDVSRRFGEDASLWDKHMNGFAAVMTAGTNQSGARDFLAFLRTEEAAEVFAQAGFTPLG